MNKVKTRAQYEQIPYRQDIKTMSIHGVEYRTKGSSVATICEWRDRT